MPFVRFTDGGRGDITALNLGTFNVTSPEVVVRFRLQWTLRYSWRCSFRSCRAALVSFSASAFSSLLRVSSTLPLITLSFRCIIFSYIVYCLFYNGVWRLHSTKFCKPCLFLFTFQFAKIILPYLAVPSDTTTSFGDMLFAVSCIPLRDIDTVTIFYCRSFSVLLRS